MVNKEAIDRARPLIKSNFGDISDLLEEDRNTLANIYYEFSYLGMQLEGECAIQDDIFISRGLNEQISKMMWFMERIFLLPTLQSLPKDECLRIRENAAFLISAVRNLPQVIAGMRQFRQSFDSTDKQKQQAYDMLLSVFRDTFKYRIPGAGEKSGLRAMLERPFYAKKVREIPDLWRLF